MNQCCRLLAVLCVVALQGSACRSSGPPQREHGGGDSGDSGQPTEILTGDSGDSGHPTEILTAERIAEVRACMEGRWGSDPTRDSLDIVKDFVACTSAAENDGAVGEANAELVVWGWAEPVPNDFSRMRRVSADAGHP